MYYANEQSCISMISLKVETLRQTEGEVEHLKKEASRDYCTCSMGSYTTEEHRHTLNCRYRQLMVVAAETPVKVVAVP